MLALTLESSRQRSLSRRAKPSFALLVGAALVAFSVACASARAQIGGFAVYTPDAVSNDKPTPSFSLPAQSADVKEALDEFARLAKHEQWEKAFKSLETIAGKTSTGFIDRGDGVLVPSRLLVRGLLAGMSSAGKNAYRLFYDSQATALWDKAAGKGEVEHLTNIVNNHLISSVGDRAADRLGDLYFEQGDFEQAIAVWQAIISYCPESKLPKAQELIKIATALARSGRWDEFSAVEQTLRERHASEAVEIAGRRVGAADQIARLASTRASEPAAEAAMPLPEDFDLPTQVEPLWQFRFQSKPDPTNSNQPFALTDIYGRQRPNDFAIPAAVDDQRAYVNLFGVEMAFDLETGKLLWRSGKLHLLQMQQNRQGVMPERYSIMVSGDRTWSVLRDSQQNNQGVGFSLLVREAATGKELFNTRRSLSAWNILGPPYLASEAVAGGPLPSTPIAAVPAGTVYVGASRTGQGRELAVLVLNAKDGKLVKNITVGNYAVDQNQVYGDRVAQPTFLMNRDRLYIDTHGGALVSMQPRTGTLNWGTLYDSPVPTTGYYYEYQPPQLGMSGPIRAGGLLFTKGMRSTRLLGVQADVPTVAWSRPVSKTAVIVGADNERIYLGGEELTAYSLQTKELLWATQLPRSAAWCWPLLTKTRLYQFTSRGICEVDTHSGEVLKIFRGADLDSFGGTMFVTPKAVVTVSNLAVTAYPRNSSTPNTQTN